MIPEGKTIDDIKAREAIIRNYYREWKTKKASEDAFVFAPECVWEVYAINVMLCGRGLRTTLIHRPHTTYFQVQKYNKSFSWQ